MMRSISPQEFEKGLYSQTKPVLLAYLRRDAAYQLQVLEEVCREIGDRIDVYLLDADCLSSFWERHGFKGTPTFMISRGGQKQSMLLGRTNAQTLNRFILDYLNSRKDS